ncbi:hypothetical protein [Roseibium sp. RKSG952]|uniref:hypothetical protein n=1 Tax=Roseibium sp. RKSG952 TaxID=2529384 RepID=UPI0012BD0FB1|nr:hypothetical protein [Roseibium sp. RKSG952]MTH94971.1 hypothetical protein [Roseibium sp. RKSG952]
MQLRKLIATAAVFSAVATSLYPATAGAEDGLRSVFIQPRSLSDYIKEHEIISDLGFFLSRDYRLPAWRSFHPLHERVRLEVVNPDYETRMGKTAPEDGTFEIDFIDLTGGSSPDLFVMSRLPDDCLPEGCLYQVYRLAYDNWIKMYEGRSRSLVYKIEGEDEPEMIAIGDQDTPSVMYKWTGYGFSEE